MRILTVRQPWAWAIIHGGKDVENRVRNIAGNWRGTIAIHAGLSFDEPDGNDWELRRAITRAEPGYPASDGDVWASDLVEESNPLFAARGVIIGVVDLVDVHRVVESGGRAHCETVATPTDPAASGACSAWAERDARHLVLANPRPLPEPILFKGALGLRELDPALAARIEREAVTA